MRAQIIAIGSELLLGDHVDTNSAWLSQRLNELGINVHRHVTVGDNIERMTAALAEADSDADVVICTGGLGPTQDDLTREALAALCDKPLVVDDDALASIRAYFVDRGYDMPDSNIRQAMRFEGAWHIGRVGTAPAIATIGPNGAFIACLPGVPAEMKAIFLEGVVPALRERGAGNVTTVSRVVRVGGVGEARVGEMLADLNTRLDADGLVTMAFLASAAEIKVRLTAQADSREEAEERIAPVLEETVTILGDHVVGLDDERVEFGIARRARAQGKTIALAESITGGGVGARLIEVPGATDFFAGGVMVYQTAMKTALAGVDARLVDAFGPASAESAEALAIGIRDRTRADMGVAVVGVAGPTTQGDLPIGRVYIAIAEGESVQVHERNCPPYDRVGIQHFAVTYTLNTIFDALGVH
ncbi:CinA family nicotinamide mononucleotide deamidase-related protein [Stomatohabitans albus]|uniref:CinA family nicotinamide mononucleotide deamidase-related protein n=1 Tax=Stomatohabitans albus TaxID=3110766 RepID=UPI00300CBBE5